MLLEEARETCAQVLGAQVEEIIFTSGATEANNLAITGWMRQKPPGSRCLVSAIEHPSVYDCAQALRHEGYVCDVWGVDQQGRLRSDQSLEGYCLIAAMAVNNEVGVCQDIPALAARPRQGARLLVDAVQAPVAGMLPALGGIDFLSLSGHKLGAPVGCGLLYVRQGLRVHPLLIGGSQEDSRRAGTSNVLAACALARALELAARESQQRQQRLHELRVQLEAGLSSIPGAHLLAGQSVRSPHISAWFFEGVLAEPLLVRLDMEGLYASSGSACSSHSLEPSRIVKAMGYSDEQSRGLVRFSLSGDLLHEDLTRVVETVDRLVREIRTRRSAL